MNTWLSTIGAAIVAGLVFFYVGRGTAPTPPPTVVRDTSIVSVLVTDTLTQIVYRNLPARIETVWVDQDDTPLQVARGKTIQQTGEYLDTVRVAYNFPPINTFDIDLGLQPRKREVRTVTVTERLPCPPPSFLDRIAVGPGFSMVYASGKLHFGPSISVSFDILP